MALLLTRACQLRVAAKKKRMPQLLRKRLIQKSRHKKCVWAAIRYKRTSAENKRLEFLEAEKSMLGARGLLVKPVLKAVNSRHKIERRKLKSKLENQHQMVWLEFKTILLSSQIECPYLYIGMCRN